MQEAGEVLQKSGVQVVAISYDSVSVLEEFAKKGEISYPLLSDPGSRTLEDFGVRNKELKGSRIDGVPHPGTFIVDKSGVIREKLFYEGYRKRHHATDIANAVKSLR